MVNWIKTNQSIGIVGQGVESYYLTQTAIRMGYQVLTYNNDPFDMAGSIADEHWIVSLDNREELKAFAEQVDVLLYSNADLAVDLVEDLMKITLLPQGYDLLALHQDQLVQKSRLDQIHLNVAPYQAVETKDQLKQALTAVGYPALLSSSAQAGSGVKQVIEAEADIESVDEALFDQDLLVSSYDPKARHFSIVVAVGEQGQLAPISLSELSYEDGRLKASWNPPAVENDIAVEMFRVALEIQDHFPFIGVMTVDFELTEMQSIYVKDIQPFTSQAGVYTLLGQDFDQYDMFIKAATNRLLPNVNHFTPAVAFPFYSGQAEAVDQIVSHYADAQIYYYNENRTGYAQGHLAFTAEDQDQLFEKIDQINRLL